jgi:predicted ATPase/DNA-binding winged helix-turn-helix (wHTH) protein
VSAVFEIGPFRLDPETRVLTHGGAPVALGARGAAVLHALVASPNEFVAKGSIIDAAWPGVVVEEGNLAVQISAIRRVLARVPGGEQWIETLPRRGYRFVGPVTEVRDRPRETEPLRPRSNLPEPLTSFVGRERELIEIKRLLPGKRLVTLVGVGGIGKTRLALQLAAEVRDAYRDGAWLVELGAITDASLVPTNVAQALGLQERTGTPLTQTLCSHLKSRQLLLLLDNCEHLLDSCAKLTDAILRGTAETTIVATSREPLQVAGEQTYSVSSLSLPDLAASAEAIGSSEAVQLFVERAKRQQPDFALTAVRAPVVAQLCIHLDGIPLALELAAVRVRSLSVEQINARLGDRFKVLTAGSRAALPRQQTLRATLDWSFDLLAEDERAVLRRLAIFVGGFTLEAAWAVASDQRSDGYAVGDLLAQLVTRSLVVADTNNAGARYRMLETTRAYALEKLAQAGEVDALRRRHAQYFRDLFEHSSEDWMRLPEAEWWPIYQSELDNVRAALDWAFGPGGDPTIGIGLAAGGGELWYWLSLRREGRQRIEAAIARIGPQTPASDQAHLWRWLGEMLTMEMPAAAVAAYERAVELHRRSGDASIPGILFVWLGEELARIGRAKQAAAVLAEAFPLLEHAATPKALAQYFLVAGVVKCMGGDLAAARADYERGLSLARSVNAERSIPGGLIFLADLAWEMGDLDTASEGFREAAALLRKRQVIGTGMVGLCLTNLAGIHTERMELDDALAAAREGLPLRKEQGYAWGALDHLALRAALAGKVTNAARIAGYADATCAAKQAPRQANEVRARGKLQTLLQTRLAPEELAHLLAEGATMSEDQACAMALED